ncbi:antirestriction protein ArdA [Lachnoclostridium sp. An118]|uniref:antirestriction protein ArdA n=1 Tax=Lachnoclostridium sp. An118 TaxID=1965547 RepID=UPI002FE67E91
MLDMIQNTAITRLPLPLQNYIDYEAYGRDLSIERRSLKQAEGYARYHIRAGRSATGKVATDSFLYFMGQSEAGCPLSKEIYKR